MVDSCRVRIHAHAGSCSVVKAVVVDLSRGVGLQGGILRKWLCRNRVLCVRVRRRRCSNVSRARGRGWKEVGSGGPVGWIDNLRTPGSAGGALR